MVSFRTRCRNLFMPIGYFLYTRTAFGPWIQRRNFEKASQIHPFGHAKSITVNYNDVSVTIIPYGHDNFGYVIRKSEQSDCVVVDCGDYKKINDYLTEQHLTPSAILCTHKHWDHVMGNEEMLKNYGDLLIYGSKLEKPSCTNRFLKDGDEIKTAGLAFRIHSVPGHTKDHLMFELIVEEKSLLFTGDFFFKAGIGIMYECGAETYLGSLKKLDIFSDSSLLFPGHEYSLVNLEFVSSIDNDTAEVRKSLSETKHKKDAKIPVCPTLLLEERQINPFLRLQKFSKLANSADNAKIIEHLSQLKDDFVNQ